MPSSWSLWLNSVVVSGVATALALGFGVAAALWACGLSYRGRRLLIGMSALALAVPPFIAANCWLRLLGNAGVWRGWLPLNIYTLPGAVWVLALLLWPIAFLASVGVWQRVQPSQLEADSAIRGAKMIRWVLWPAARPALAQAAVLTFVLALNNFAIPAILQVKLATAEIWIAFSTQFDSWGALALSWPLIVAPLVLLTWLGRQEIAWPSLEGEIGAHLFRSRLGRPWFLVCGALTLLVVAAAVALPVSQLAVSSGTWRELPNAYAAGQPAVMASLGFAALTATLTVALGIVTWRLPVGPILWLPFLVPGVLLGIGLIAVLNRPGLDLIYHSCAIVLLALGIRYVAFGWNGAALARRGVDPDLTDAARLSGARRWQLFALVHWPQVAPRLAAAWYVTYLLCLWDVESIVLIVPPGGETLALRVFNLLHYGHNSQVNALCMILLILALLPLLVWQIGRAARSAFSSRSGGLGGYPAIGSSLALLAAMTLLAGCSGKQPNQAALDSRIFDHAEIIGTRGTAPGQFNKPRSVAVDDHDNLYVVDMTGRVQKFSPRGVFLTEWQMPQTDLGKPKGMCRDRAGRIVVLEPHYSRVNHFSQEGKLVQQWGVHGTNAGQMALPRSVAVNSLGEIWVSEYGVTERLQRFSPDGSRCLMTLGSFGEGAGQFNRAEGLGLDARDGVHVADSCNHRIEVFSSAGQWQRTYGHAGRGPGELSYPYDVRVDSEGHEFVCEFGNSRIQIFDSGGHSLEILGGPGIAPGQFSNPWAIALDSLGNLYVADAGNHRVQKLVRRVRGNSA